MNKNALLAKLAYEGIDQRKLAKEMNITENTLSRKINGKNYFTLGEVNSIKEILKLSGDEILAIFFVNDVDKKATD